MTKYNTMIRILLYSSYVMLSHIVVTPIMIGQLDTIFGLAAFMRGRELSTLVVITLAAAGE